jgi:hypothetical protein
MKNVVLYAYTSISVVRNNFRAIAVPLVHLEEFRYKDHAIGCHPTGRLGVAVTFMALIRKMRGSNIGLIVIVYFLSPSRKTNTLVHYRFLPNLFLNYHSSVIPCVNDIK